MYALTVLEKMKSEVSGSAVIEQGFCIASVYDKWDTFTFCFIIKAGFSSGMFEIIVL